MYTRPKKGTNLLTVPNDYVVIDIETTGLSPQYDSIIEVAAIKYSGGVEIDRFNSLVQPPEITKGIYVNEYIENLTGITNEMLSSAPQPQGVFEKYFDFIGNSVVIGQNVNYDINFLYDNFEHYIGQTFGNDFVDTMRISKNLHPEDAHHSLVAICNRYGIDYIGAHRSLQDCLLAHSALISLCDDARNTFGSYDGFLNSIKERRKRYTHTYLRAKDISCTEIDFDKTHPLYGKVCVFTGALERMIRRDAMQLVANFGGINADSVTKKTNYLILGNNDYCKSIKDGKSSKQKKAEKLKLDGLDIEILPESVFYDMLDDHERY